MSIDTNIIHAEKKVKMLGSSESAIKFVFMVLPRKYLLAALLLIMSGAVASSQQDSVAADSAYARIRALLTGYNQKMYFVDTTGYEETGWDSENYNLLTAASQGACNEILRFISEGADVNFTAPGGKTPPLHFAISSGVSEAVEILLLLGADPDQTDMFGNPPLVVAARAGSIEMSETLIRYGAKTGQTDYWGSTALHHAVALNGFYMADMLLYYDAPVNIRDNEGNTPLMVSVAYDMADIADLLLQNGADPNVADRDGFTPLMVAAQNGDTLIMRLVIRSGADLYAVNREGFDALGCASRSGSTQAASILLQSGMRWNYSQSQPVNPVTVAENYGQKKIISLLSSYGIEEKKDFNLEEISFRGGGRFANHYLMTDVSVIISDPRTNAGLIAGAATNPFNYRMLVKESEDLYYQYRVNTSVFYAGFIKKFPVKSTPTKGRFSVEVNLSAGYRLHSRYEGTRQKPQEGFCFMPSAGMEWTRKFYGLYAGISWLNVPFYKVSPVWFNAGASLSLFSKNARSSGKKIRLYDYE